MVTPTAPSAGVKIAKPPQNAHPGGVLPVSTIETKANVTSAHGQTRRQHAAGIKVNVRRLPPGLTQEEFQTALGDEWKQGSPQVDWCSYIPGKVSKDPAKPSRPARAYLHLTDAYTKEHASEPLKELQARLSSGSFNDAKGTHTDPALLAPWPTVSEAPYGRMPSGRIRKDNRQGTIDQEQDFIDFLQELTNPLVKPIPIDAATDKENKSDEKIVTPLVQYLRDKKANKAKEASSGGKGGKHSRQESKDPKASVHAGDKKASSKSQKESLPDKKSAVKAEKPAKEQVKVLSKQSAKAQVSTAPAVAKPGTSATSTNDAAGKTTAAAAKPERKRERERGSIAAAAKILQRDLGLGGSGSGRRRKDVKDTSSSNAEDQATQSTQPTTDGTSPAAPSSTPVSNPPTSITAPSILPDPQDASKGGAETKVVQAPAASRSNVRGQAKAGTAPVKPTPTTSKATPAATPASVTPTATEAFLKHANPSQGITEPLLQSTFASFGIVTKVEIDKKKGFAYLSFAEPEALQKAVAASPVKIAQGAVVVLERKTPNQPATRTPRPELRGGRGGGANAPTRGGRGRGRGGRQGTEGHGQASGTATTPTASAQGGSKPAEPDAPAAA